MNPYVLLIIDPQVDFHEGGSLAVTGAMKDSERIIDLITKAPPTAIYVSLDTHTPNHIGHAGFWTPMPNPFTAFRVENGKIMGSDNIEYTPVRADLKAWALDYVTELTGKKGPRSFTPLIWPTHCLEDQPGHAVYGPLKNALDLYTTKGGKLEYHIKGQNESAEMYSIFQAEVANPPEVYSGAFTKTNSSLNTTDTTDHAYLNTSFNNELYNKLMNHGTQIVVCGEAKSHCVNWSTRDLINKRNSENDYGKKTRPVVLLNDCTSPVPGDMFIPATQEFERFCREINGKQNVRIVLKDDFLRTLGIMTGGKRSRRVRKGRSRKNKSKGKKK
jgi:nicotinamidase-related amidase